MGATVPPRGGARQRIALMTGISGVEAASAHAVAAQPSSTAGRPVTKRQWCQSSRAAKRAPGTPAERGLRQRPRRRARRQREQVRGARGEGEVAGGEDVRPLLREQQVDGGGPGAEARNGGDVRRGLRVRHAAQRREVEPAVQAGARERAGVRRLGPRQAGRAAERRVVEREQPCRVQRAGQGGSRRQIAAAAWLLICWPQMARSRPGKPGWRTRQGSGPAAASTAARRGSSAASSLSPASAQGGGVGKVGAIAVHRPRV